ncbi:hypothetical protein Ocin01_15315 [Orchesella cincta]|uniref:Uncharacterized protein n=1 Tax=Orchesella cincta TaxID=48709 RepID=A0A1D2MEL1_ORCCI|nr:hypothetical protein Ocin01_15315 [Orchesella cincta]
MSTSVVNRLSYLRSSCASCVAFFLIIFESSVLLCQATSVPDCIVYSFNPNTSRLECTDITEIDFGTSTSSDGDLQPLRNIILYAIVIIAVIMFFYCVRNCGASFGRFRNEEERNNFYEGPIVSSSPTIFPSAPLPQSHPHIIVLSPNIQPHVPVSRTDSDLPEYQPPPAYHECVIDLSDEVPKKNHHIPQASR